MAAAALVEPMALPTTPVVDPTRDPASSPHQPAGASSGQAAPPPSDAPPATPGSASRRPVGRWIVAGLAAVAIILGGWWGLGYITDGEYGGTPPTGSSSEPPSSRRAPDAPSSDVLRSGDWLLASYRLTNDGTDMSVSATITNVGTVTASADLTVWIYLADGTSLGSVETTVTDVPAGGSVEVTMTGDAVWAPGAKTVLLEAS